MAFRKELPLTVAGAAAALGRTRTAFPLGPSGTVDAQTIDEKARPGKPINRRRLSQLRYRRPEFLPPPVPEAATNAGRGCRATSRFADGVVEIVGARSPVAACGGKHAGHIFFRKSAGISPALPADRKTQRGHLAVFGLQSQPSRDVGRRLGRHFAAEKLRPVARAARRPASGRPRPCTLRHGQVPSSVPDARACRASAAD